MYLRDYPPFHYGLIVLAIATGVTIVAGCICGVSLLVEALSMRRRGGGG